MSSEEYENEIHRYWSSALFAAAESAEHTVELTADDTGMHFEIDGVRMLDGNGYPSESFEMTGRRYEYTDYLTDDGVEKVREVYDA